MIRLVAGRSPASQGRACALRAEPPAESQAEPLVPNAKLTAADIRPALAFAFPGKPTIRNIQDEVADFYGINRDYMRAPDRQGAREPRISHPRQVAMFFSRHCTRHSLTVIGKSFHRDHSTVLHAIRVVGKRAETDPILGAELEVLAERFCA